MTEHSLSRLMGQNVGAALAEDRTRLDFRAKELVPHRGPVGARRVVSR